jgi:hypothetical protein
MQQRDVIFIRDPSLVFQNLFESREPNNARLISLEIQMILLRVFRHIAGRLFRSARRFPSGITRRVSQFFKERTALCRISLIIRFSLVDLAKPGFQANLVEPGWGPG